MALVVHVAAGVANVVGVRPGERHVAHAQAVIIAQDADVAFDGVPAFHAQQRGELMLAMRGQDVLGAEGHHHLVGMAARLLVDRVDHVERALGFVAFIRLRLDPDGKEFRAQIAGLDLVEIHVAGAGVLREIEILVDETAGRVGVSVDDDGRIVDGSPALVRGSFGLRRRRLCRRGDLGHHQSGEQQSGSKHANRD